MGSSFIREGDTTSHGGRVLACTSTNIVFGKPLALEGDTVSYAYSGERDHAFRRIVIMDSE
ncbi:PAAR domain-containing protein [Burkholderia vietnamiensis]|uniref:PAAR domain-containing protein n=1 Tax=Burkholderia vietnamiensis TaxID=60552 RepID=A0AAW7T0I3_BURVI|nr:PAAR domain-containing protein [Burkholderia vietnamiensis]MDN7795054.1 PAAR domain-containing protein [Burkholderia vietnamiensis]